MAAHKSRKESVKRKAGRQQKRAQSSVEYLSVYGFAIAIIVLVVALIYIFVNSSSRTVPSGCTFASGVACSDIVVGLSGSSSSNALLLLTNTQSYPVVSPSLKINLEGRGNVSGVCIPSYVLPGGTMLCNATVSSTYSAGSLVTAYVYVTSTSCVSGNAVACQSLPQQIYTGTLNSEYQGTGPVTQPSITMVAANAATKTGIPDRLDAIVTLGGVPLGGADINFTANTMGPAFSPAHEATDNNGNATSYMASYRGGDYLVTASFGKYTYNTVVDFNSSYVVTFVNSNAPSTSNIVVIDGITYSTSQLPVVLSAGLGSQEEYAFNSAVVTSIEGCGLTSLSGIFTIIVNCTVVANPSQSTTTTQQGTSQVEPDVSLFFPTTSTYEYTPDEGWGTTVQDDTLIMCGSSNTGGVPYSGCPSAEPDIVSTGATNGGSVYFDTKVLTPNGQGWYYLQPGVYDFRACDLSYYTETGTEDCSSVTYQITVYS